MLHRYLPASLVCLALSVGPLYAQQDRGIITGVVQDGTGAMIPGSRITATRLATNTPYTTESTQSGDYTIASLPTGEYTVKVERDGFKTSLSRNIIVTAAGSARVDVTLELGQTGFEAVFLTFGWAPEQTGAHPSPAPRLVVDTGWR